MPVDSDKRVQYCDECKRIKGIGCVCGMSFKERMKATSIVLPASFRAVKG
jgi:hypothetical protein